MDLQELQIFFGYMSLINFGLLVFVFAFITLAGKWVHRLHSQIFNVPEELIGKTLYQIIAIYKIIILVFNVIPWLTLKYLL